MAMPPIALAALLAESNLADLRRLNAEPQVIERAQQLLTIVTTLDKARWSSSDHEDPDSRVRRVREIVKLIDEKEPK